MKVKQPNLITEGEIKLFPSALTKGDNIMGAARKLYYQGKKDALSTTSNQKALIEATVNNAKNLNDLTNTINVLAQENQKQHDIFNDNFNHLAQAKNQGMIHAVCVANKPTYDCNNLSLEQSCEIAEMAGITIDNCGNI